MVLLQGCSAGEGTAARSAAKVRCPAAEGQTPLLPSAHGESGTSVGSQRKAEVPSRGSNSTFERPVGAEFLGTFGLVFGGCGSAVLAAVFLNEGQVQLGIGFVGVALAFGLTVLTGAYAFGHVSGGHFNPAVTVGLAVAKRFEWRGVLPYIGAQVAAASLAAAVLFLIATGKSGTSAAEVMASGFASNGYGDRSPAGYGTGAALLIEIVLTAAFLYVILGATDDRAPKGFAPLAIGLALTLIHLVSIPVTNTSVNPARSLGVAWFAGGSALAQVWLFLLAPVVGAAIAGATYAAITGAQRPVVAEEGIANNPRTDHPSVDDLSVEDASVDAAAPLSSGRR